MKPKLAPQKVERDLSKLVNLRTVQKPISDARTATYVILSIGSGPGGRRFKSFRPDHFLTPAGNSLKIGLRQSIVSVVSAVSENEAAQRTEISAPVSSYGYGCADELVRASSGLSRV